MAGLLGAPHLWSALRRGQLKHLVPSNPSHNLYPFSILNIRFILKLCSSSFSDHCISRTLLPLRTRSKYSTHASLRWRNFSSSPQAMKRKKDSVKVYQCMQVVSVQAELSNPPSKLEDIEEQLRSLLEKSALLRFANNVQNSRNVSGLLEDLQEAFNDYMVRS